MFTANGRAGKRTTDKSAKASVKGKEFVCAVCGEVKRISNVEFGEAVLCSCGQPMEEKDA